MTKRRIWLGLLLIAVAVVAAPFWKADRFSPALAASLERALQRKVEVGAVRLHLLTGPGFTLSDVVIHEDPSVSAEPLAYVTSLVVRLRLLALLRGSIEFSALRLEEPSVNLMQTGSGLWNVQALLRNSSPTTGGDLPDLEVRNGRLNIKIDGTKSVYYFTNTDLDFSAQTGGQSFEIWFRGEPARTDRPAQGFGQMTGRGRWLRPESGEPRLEIDYQLEPSALEELTTLLASRDIGLHGVVASRGRLAGPVSAMELTGSLELNDLHYWNQPPRPGKLRVGYKGVWNLTNHEFRVATDETPDNPLPLRAAVRLGSYLASPRWQVELELRQLPLSVAIGWLRPGGGRFSDLQAEGALSGRLEVAHDRPSEGRLEASEVALSDNGAPVLKAANFAIAIAGGKLRFEAPVIEMGPRGAAALDYEWNWSAQEVSAQLQAKSLGVEQLQQLAALAGERPPLVSELKRGQLRGQIRLRRQGEAAPEWNGTLQLTDALTAVPEFAEPLQIVQAALELRGDRLNARAITARAGQVEWTGDYQYDPAQRRPHRFQVNLEAVDAAELEKLLTPALLRERGFLARTLGIGVDSVPDWLASRRAEGKLSIGRLTVGPETIRDLETAVQWDASRVSMSPLRFAWDEAALEGELGIDLRKARPVYTANGRATGISWQDGTVALQWKADSRGMGLEIVRNARVSGEVSGEQVQAGEILARQLRAKFGLRAEAGNLLLDIDGIEAETSAGVWTGRGRTQREGKLVVDLTNDDRETRLNGKVFPLELR